jgi:aryl-alcohol dehydrogenase-like predicted oxidoreductase
MEHRSMGRSGLLVSEVGLGCNNFGASMDAARVEAVVRRALDEGVTFFDTAESYSKGVSEEMLGAALGRRRDEAVVATKFGARAPSPSMAAASRANVVRACDDSLRRLGTDHIDLLYLHRPDPLTPVEETLSALDALVRSGKVRYVAASGLAGWQVADAEHLARTIGAERYVANQIEWNLLTRDVESEVVPACRHFGVGIVPYFPLASGLLTGKYRRGVDPPEGTRLAGGSYFSRVLTDENFDKVERLTAFASAAGRSLLELAIGWLLSQDGVASVIAGATSPEQLVANVEASTWHLTADELAAVDVALAGDPAED